MKTKELTIDVLAMRHEESKLADRGLAQLIVEANFETLPDFQEFMQLAGEAHVSTESFAQNVERLKHLVEAMYGNIKKTGEGETVSEYFIHLKKERKRHDLLKTIYDSLQSYDQFRGWYQNYALDGSSSLAVRSMADFREQGQLDNIVVYKGAQSHKLGGRLSYDSLPKDGQERFKVISDAMRVDPFNMKQSDINFVLFYINQHKCFTNISGPLTSCGMSTGGIFAKEGTKWSIADVESKRPILIFLNQANRLVRLEAELEQKVLLIQSKKDLCSLKTTQVMSFESGKMLERKSTISSDKPFTVPAELLVQGLEAHSTFIKELGVFEQVNQYLADSVKLIANKLKEFYEKTKAPKKKQLILSSDMDKVEGSELMPSRVLKVQGKHTGEKSRRTKHGRSMGGSGPHRTN